VEACDSSERVETYRAPLRPKSYACCYTVTMIYICGSHRARRYRVGLKSWPRMTPLRGGAIQALEDNHLSGKVLVTGQDADLAAVVRLYDGTPLMTIYKPLVGEARTAAEAAVTLARHGNVETATTVPCTDNESNPYSHLRHSAQCKRDGSKGWLSKDRNRKAVPAKRQMVRTRSISRVSKFRDHVSQSC
jgi:Periplasmic binding protein domain